MFTEPEFKTISFPVEVDQTVQKGQGVTIKISADLDRVDLNLLSEIANSGVLDLTLKSRQTEMIKDDKIIHVYDVKASIVPKRGKDRKRKMAKVFVNPSMRKSIDDFQRHYGIPVELVAPMAGRFRMTILGTTIPIGVYEFTGCGYDVSKIIGK